MYVSLLALTTMVPVVFGQARGDGNFLRFGCSQLVVERIDPLVAPGLNPSPHTHQVVGGNSFNASVWLYSLLCRSS